MKDQGRNLMTKAINQNDPYPSDHGPKDCDNDRGDNAHSHLCGLLLISMPGLNDTEFDHSVIFVCQHDTEHAFGLVLNHPIAEINLKEVLSTIEFDQDVPSNHLEPFAQTAVFRGGPVDKGRGFVLHSPDYQLNHSTIIVTQNVQDDSYPNPICGLTSSRDILVDMVKGSGPQKTRFTLGYAGWGLGNWKVNWHAIFGFWRRRPMKSFLRPNLMKSDPRQWAS